jgi:hypothetical protein
MGKMLSEIGRKALELKNKGRIPKFVVVPADKFEPLREEIRENYLLYQRISRLFDTGHHFKIKIGDVDAIVVSDQAEESSGDSRLES